jgi:inhibitor of KinA sporulation pathway (predicted exonuclease)
MAEQSGSSSTNSKGSLDRLIRDVMTVLQTPPASTLTVFDLEFTAWEGSMATHWLRPGEFKEVVQIGAVKLDRSRFQILDEFDCLVRPRINREVSAYFEGLTGITNETLQARGMDFSQALVRFLAFAAGGPICAFGRDEWVLEENIRLYGLRDLPPLPRCFDLRGWFAARRLDPRGLHSCEIGAALGVPFTGRAHNALDDARSVARGMEAMVARGASAVLAA